MMGGRHARVLLATLVVASCGADPPSGPDNAPVDARPETTRLVEALRAAGATVVRGEVLPVSSTPSLTPPPHFYRQSRLIVLYVGSDRAIMTLLEGLLGPQFAGSPPG